MRPTLTTTINGKPATIGTMPPEAAFDCGCCVAIWRGKRTAATGTALGGVTTRADVEDPLAVDIPVGQMMAINGAAMEQRGRMLRDPDYRSAVWLATLALCTLDGQAVMLSDGRSLNPAHDLGDLFALHEAAIDHNCGTFLRPLG